ncbi:MAG: hypothetical protein ACQEP4_09230 [Bacillota bacterium]
MKNKDILLIGFALLLLFGFIIILLLLEDRNSDPYIHVADDSLGSWYFNSSSIEERVDYEEKINVIDVWVKHDINLEGNECGRDELLWHIDLDGSRYKVSDAYTYDTDDNIIET